MAEAVVGVLIGKLGAALANGAAAYGASLLCKEASALNGLFGEIRKAEGELESMKAYLHDAEKFKNTNETTGIFVKKIRDLAFRIEDVVDEFTYKLEDDKHGGLAAKMKKRIKHVKIWRRLALELHDINADLEEAAKRRDRYAMPGMEGYAGDGGNHARSTNQTSCPAREDDLVGIEDNVDKLTQWLVGDLEEKNYKIATVWGMGGAGKTTLVDHVYKIVKIDFDTSAWVTVSKSYQVEDLLKKVSTEFGISVDASNMEMRNLVEVIRVYKIVKDDFDLAAWVTVSKTYQVDDSLKNSAREFGISVDATNMQMIRLVQVIRNYLEGKRYILVLDDVWEEDVCIKIMDVFPTNCISRFVLTSRKLEVASLATSDCIIKQEPLEKKSFLGFVLQGSFSEKW